jgi:SAM-dependent methyltransferase
MPFKHYIRKADQRGEYWEGQTFEEYLSLCDSQLTTELLLDYLPHEGPILEAGCGLARWVIFLRGKGFNVVGLDASQHALQTARRHASTIPLINADILHMPFGNNVFAAILSFGVVEHFERDMQATFQEMRRVLRKRGLLFLAVPYTNLLRRTLVHPYILLKNTSRKMRGVELVFDEYTHSRAELRRLLVQNGFEPLKIVPDDLRLPYAMGLCRDFRNRLGDPQKFTLNRMGVLIATALNKLSPWIACGGVFCVARRVK